MTNTADVPSQLDHWQMVARQLPLPQLQEMYDDAFIGLADSLNAFNRLRRAPRPDSGAVEGKTHEVCGRAVVAAIFALAMNHRLHQEAALN
jgi:hypothetical protein